MPNEAHCVCKRREKTVNMVSGEVPTMKPNMNAGIGARFEAALAAKRLPRVTAAAYTAPA